MQNENQTYRKAVKKENLMENIKNYIKCIKLIEQHKASQNRSTIFVSNKQKQCRITSKK